MPSHASALPRHRLMPSSTHQTSLYQPEAICRIENPSRCTLHTWSSPASSWKRRCRARFEIGGTRLIAARMTGCHGRDRYAGSAGWRPAMLDLLDLANCLDAIASFPVDLLISRGNGRPQNACATG
jgi:hypothetical protein